MKSPQIGKIWSIPLVLAAAFLTNINIALGVDAVSIFLDLSYSLAPNVVRQTELWEIPKRRILLVTEYYCPGHSNYGKVKHLLLRPPSQDWSQLEKFHPDSQMGQLRDSACKLLAKGKFRLKSAEDYSDLGYKLRQEGRLSEAIDVLTKVVELYPNRAYLYNNLGNTLWADLQFEEAIAVYRQGIELTSDRSVLSSLYTGLGNALDDNGSFVDAIDAYRQAIAIKSDNPIPHFDLAIALSRQGEIDEAIRECQLAIQLDPNAAAPQELLRELKQKQATR